MPTATATAAATTDLTAPADPSLPTLTDADIRHRQDFESFVLSHARARYRAYLSRFYRLWQEWNDTFYDGYLVTPYLLLAEPSSPHALGDYSSLSGFGGHGQIRLRPSLLALTRKPHRLLRPGPEYAEGRFLYVADVLLHETVHQYQHEVLANLEDAYHGHGPQFRDRCNLIGARLGLGPVRSSKARGKDRHLPSCADWPECVRPEGYYLGALADDVPANGDGGSNGKHDGTDHAGEDDGQAVAVQELKKAALKYAREPTDEAGERMLAEAVRFAVAYQGGGESKANPQGEGEPEDGRSSLRIWAPAR